MADPHYKFAPYYGKIKFTAKNENAVDIVMPVYVIDSDIKYNIDPRRTTIAADPPGNLNSPVSYDVINIVSNGGSIDITGYILSPILNTMRINAIDMLKIITGSVTIGSSKILSSINDIASITLTSTIDPLKTVTYLQCKPVSNNLTVGAIGSYVVYYGSIGYKFGKIL